MIPVLRLAIAASLLVTHAAITAAQSGHDLFQQALLKERSHGQIQQAIALYRRIIAENGADRALAARSLVQLGRAYETLGDAEARPSYERVLRDYADQEAEAAIARGRLIIIEPRLPVRRLVDAVPIQDGRHALRYNQERRGFDLIEIQSKKARPLTSDGPAPDTIAGSNPVELSRDGRRLAVRWHFVLRPGEPVTPANTGGAELRVLNVGGRGAGDLLHSWEPGINIQIFGWSPAGDRVWVLARRPDLSAEIASVSITKRSVEVLKTIRWRTSSQPPSLSPDGRFIAYQDADTRDAPHDLFLLATDGSREVRVEHPSNDGKPLFAPDGSGVIFDSDRRDGIRDLWFLPVKDGRPAGEPRLIFEDVSPYGHVYRFANNGSVYYYIATNRNEVYTASIDLAAGRVGPPELLQRLNGEENTTPAYSPDGRFLAHLRNRSRRLVVRNLATQSEREFPIGPSLTYALSLDWCPDGRSVVVTGFQRSWFASRIDVVQGGVERLALADPFQSRCLDANEILYAQFLRDPKLARRNVTTGTETTLFEGKSFDYTSGTRWPGVARSPDAAMISFVERDSVEARLVVMPSRGGAVRIVARSPVHRSEGELLHDFLGVMWLPAGDGLLVVKRVGAPAPGDPSPEVRFSRVPLAVGDAKEVGRMRLPAFEQSIYGAYHFSLSPDGSRVAFERHAGLVSQDWAIDNVLAFIQSGASATLPTPRPR